MRLPSSSCAALAALLLAPIAAASQGAPSRGTIVVRAARLIDGTGAAPVRNGVVVISGDTIAAVGAAGRVAIPKGAKSIDLHDATLLPGFIDAHTHIIGRVLGEPGWDVNVGAGNFDDVALRQAINEGRVPGPRMQNAGHALGITGGHCDENGYRPGLLDGSIRETTLFVMKNGVIYKGARQPSAVSLAP